MQAQRKDYGKLRSTLAGGMTLEKVFPRKTAHLFQFYMSKWYGSDNAYFFYIVINFYNLFCKGL